MKIILNFNIQKNKQIVLNDWGRFKFTFDNLPKYDNLATSNMGLFYTGCTFCLSK